MFAYLDTLVRPVVMPVVRTDTFKVIDKIVGQDTLTSDSIVTSEFLAYGPNNLYLRLFQEKLTQLYMTDDERKSRERLDFVSVFRERTSSKPASGILRRPNRCLGIGI